MRSPEYPDLPMRNRRRERLNAENASFDYDYPYPGLKPGEDLHTRLLNYGTEIVSDWEGRSTDYREDLRDLQWTLTGYVKPEDANPRNNTKDKKNVCVLPMSHRNRHMIHAAWHSVYMRNPVWRVVPGCGPVALVNAATMEYAVQQQVTLMDAGLHLHTAVDDAIAFGESTLGTEWRQKRGRKPVDTEITAMAVELAKAQGLKASSEDINTLVREFKDAILYEGTQLRPWDPFRTITDLNTTVNFYQEAEYGGRTYDTNIPKLIGREMDDAADVARAVAEGKKPPKRRYFNAEYVKLLADAGLSESYWNSEYLTTGRNDRTGYGDSRDNDNRKTTHVGAIYLEMSIIPKDWNVGDETWPVKYFLEISADEIVTGFGPLDFGDGNYSFVKCGPNTTGHEICPVGDLMVNYGSHKFANNMIHLVEMDYRKMVNGGWTFINPEFVDVEHLLNQQTPHKLGLWSKPYISPEQAKAAVMQFPHQSRSAEHLALINQLFAWDSDGIGTSNIMADMNIERPTKPGVQGAFNQQHSRMRVWCWKFGQQMMQDLFWRYAYNQVQFASLPVQASYQGRFKDRILREIGRPGNGLPWEIDPTYLTATVDPKLMNLEFQMEPFTGDMPEMGDPSMVAQILQQAAATDPMLAAEMWKDLPLNQVMRQFLRMIHFPDVEAFDSPMPAGGQAPQGQMGLAAMPDEQLQSEVQAGNYIPVPMEGRYPQ